MNWDTNGGGIGIVKGCIRTCRLDDTTQTCLNKISWVRSMHGYPIYLIVFMRNIEASLCRLLNRCPPVLAIDQRKEIPEWL